ncbi:ExbD/TolR family protein [Sphingobium sp. SYK-6]|uniref:ExbD/TolR family protein n=1 Tax=Sphingobium sp. (strain NBRC 103272 / SYK-6) TaxID=627192 RepID=UPI0011D197D4|nr:hypothetical protein [Sphingobium sp. SYK-6]
MRQHDKVNRYRTALTVLLVGLVTGCSRAPQTYAADCPIPLPHWGREKDGVGHLMMVQPVYLTSDGSILWNKTIISDDTLRRYMMQMSAMKPQPQVVLDVAPSAACSRVAAVRAIMDAAPMCRGPYSHCSEGWNWEQWPELGT